MLYDRYHDKMKRVATVLRKLYALLPLIIIALVLLVVTGSAMIATKGLVVLETACPEEVVYGEKLGYHAVILWGVPTYEYREAGADETGWSREKPEFPGKYQVRAYGRTSWFTKNYTEIKDFTIVPREISPVISDTRIAYGETPRVTADLARGDVLTCEVVYDGYTTSTTARVDWRSISITDKKGNDRIAGYVVKDTPDVSLTVEPRSIEITVQDASKVYDGLKLSFDGYEISKGTLVEGDRLVAVFNASITHAGQVENTPTLRVYNEKSADVTGLYAFTIRSGRLTVEKRPLVIRTGSATRVYDGRGLSCTEFTVSDDTPLVGGHVASVLSATALVDCGAVENVLTLQIHGRAGNDCSNDYSVFVEAGTLTVTPREVSIQTDSAELVYDGTDQRVPTAQVENGVGDEVQAVNCPAIRDVGSIENRFQVRFFRDGKDITDNYVITGYTYGTVSVYPRSITVQIDNVERTYTGKTQTSAAFTVLPDMPYGLAEGHTMTLKTTGSVRFGSTGLSYVEDSAVILDAAGKDVTDQYRLTVYGGLLSVVPRPVTVTTPDAEKIYDGKPLSNNTYSITSGSILVGHVFDVEVDASITDAGSVRNAVKRITITDAANGEDVSRYYNVTLNEGTLTVRGVPVTIRTFGDEWMYDGNPHAGDMEFEWDPDEFLPGHYPTQAITSPVAVTEAGIHPNAVYVKILDGGVDVTHNYEIHYEFGDLVIQKRPIIVEFSNETRVYDGKGYGSDDCHQAFGLPDGYALVSGHALTVQPDRMILHTDVGVYANVQPVDVVDGNTGRLVTSNYAISYRQGTLVITQRPLDISLTGEKIYDAAYPKNEDFTLVYLNGTTPANGHTVSARPRQVKVEDAGTTSASIDQSTLTILDAKGKDVAKNYFVTYYKGSITIHPRPVSMVTATASKQYDGTPLTANTVSLAEDSLPLLEGDRVILRTNGKGTEVGQYLNTCDPSTFAVRRNGQNVTRNYTLTSVTEGVLTVMYPCTVTVTTGSAVKDYDGLPLFCDDYTVEITDGALPAGMTVYVNVTGSIVRPGSIDNAASVAVLDGEGNDVTALVDVRIVTGVLTVRESEIAATTVGYVYAQKSGVIYLRMASYGNYNGRSWGDAQPYDGLLNGTDSFQYLPSIAIETLRISTAHTLQFADMKAGLLPYYSKLGGAPAGVGDIHCTDIRNSDYTVTYYPVENAEELIATFRGLPDYLKPYVLGSYSDEEEAYRAFVYEQYLTVDAGTIGTMKNIIKEQGFDPADPAVIGAVAEYVRNVAVYDPDYDTNLDASPNVIVSFLMKYKRGVSTHFAGAATLLYRSLGIPARYVTGFSQNVAAGEWVEITTPGYAWVEVYVDGLGWIPVDVTGSTEPVEPPVAAPDVTELVLIPAYCHRIYDGSYLYAIDELVLTPELESLLALGYTYTVEISGQQREIGIGTSHVTAFTLYDPLGRDVTAAFAVIRKAGALQVTAAAVEILLYPVSKTVDGTGTRWGEGDYEVIGLPDGVVLEQLSLSVTSSGVGYFTLADLNRGDGVSLNYRLTRNGVDVTREYALVFTLPDGMEETPTLTVSPRVIELTAASESRVDDGEPLRNGTVYLSKGSLLAGHTLTASAEGVQVGVGTSENRVDTASVRILDEHGNDVTHLYRIQTLSGWLTVVKTG